MLKSKPDGIFASNKIILMEIVKSTVKETSASSVILLCKMRASRMKSRLLKKKPENLRIQNINH